MLSVKSKISDIDRANLCLGCGLCESICGKEHVHMQLKPDGFFHPVVKKVVPEAEKIITAICPGINITNDIAFSKKQSIWGNIETVCSGYATDNEVRTRGSSGGVVSGLAIYLLSSKTVDAVLQVGGDPEDYERNSLRISYTRADVLNCASSRYAPALIFDKILAILKNSNDTYCFIGKPCDVSALKNFLSKYPIYADRFKLTIAIMCAGLPSFKGTQAIIDSYKPKLPIKNLSYRGNGWPGYFSFRDGEGTSFKQSYNDSWGKTLNQHLHFRCKICPEGIGLQADIAIGDAWETKDGYPDFTEKEGQSLIITRTDAGEETLLSAAHAQEISFTPLKSDIIRYMQPYQYTRRTRAGIRRLAVYVTTGKWLNFKHMHLHYNMRYVKATTLLRDFLGTVRRTVKHLKQNG
ncbi:Coenzyme F420 hydrogenase/dehydrogenase, beta subunit C-terminal domain [Olivibacter sp. SDN3]|uniref:Coenzyme F420 hydrogenase/dehydrogenase, beta subunit C-terminal domain n=1 Tax=Olivibacter sp. SDN3 TaxID=2764720 RepID=UPI0016515C1E|nr:Coenzyme F420 hydrogenase/dehydrogenase, beta subunit C-terminal domain [Olivibacter sp. SDN3]QNL52092.1 Coenzyme F420 hydrogenase/dehydrogenase, beta subunit C-terminal domain [Olivibacter sp. SDN3]